MPKIALKMKVRIKIDPKKKAGIRFPLNEFLTQYFNKFYSDLNDTVSGYRSVQEHANRDKIIQFVSGKIPDFDLLRLLIRGAFLLRDFDLLHLKQTDIEEQSARISEISNFIADIEKNMRMSFVPVPNINHALQTYLNPNTLLIRQVDGCLEFPNDKNNNQNNILSTFDPPSINFKEMNRIMKIYLLREDVENYTVSDGVFYISSKQFNCELVLCGLYSNPVWKIIKVNSTINSRALESAVMRRMDGSLKKLLQFLAYHDSCTVPSCPAPVEPPTLQSNNVYKITRHFRVGALILEFNTVASSFTIIHNVVDRLQKSTHVELLHPDSIITTGNNSNKLIGFYSRNTQDQFQKKNLQSNPLDKNRLNLISPFVDNHILLFECFLAITSFVPEARLDNAVITRHFVITVFPTNNDPLITNNTQTPTHPTRLAPSYKLFYLKIPTVSYSFLNSNVEFDSTNTLNLDIFCSSNLKSILRRAELVLIQHNIPDQYKLIEHTPNEKLLLEIPGLKLLITNSFKSTLKFLTEDCASFTFTTALTFVLNFHKFYLCSLLPLVATEKSLIFDYEELLGENITITVTPSGYKITGEAARKALNVPSLFSHADDSVFTKLFRAYIVNRFYAIKKILNISTSNKNSLILQNNHSIVITEEGLKYFNAQNSLVSETTRILNTERIILNALKTAALILN